MNLFSYAFGWIRGIVPNGQLKIVETTAQQDAETVVGAYVTAFERRVGELLRQSHQRLIGEEVSDDLLIGFEPVEEEPAQDYSDWTRPELMATCREQEIKYDRYAKKADLIAALLDPTE